MFKKFLLAITAAMAVCSLSFAVETENVVTISANGVKRTYLFDTFRSAVIQDKTADQITFNVNYNDGKPSEGNIRTVARVISELPDEEEEQQKQEEVEVDTHDTSAEIKWPIIIGAITYKIQICLDRWCRNVICTITLDQYGRLIGIDFSSWIKSADESLAYTVTGLEPETEYFYDIVALGSADEQVGNPMSGTFTTDEEVITSVGDNSDNDIDVYTRSNTIVVNADKESSVTFYDTLGHQIGDCIKTTHCECTVTVGGVYIVIVDGKQYKVLIG